jgi:hypothetical protein
MSENELIDLPQAAAALGRSSDAVKRLLLRRPDLDAAIARRWGRRLLSRKNVEAVRRAFAEREKAALR